MGLQQTCPRGAESEVDLEVTPIFGVTLSDGRCPGERARTRRYVRVAGRIRVAGPLRISGRYVLLRDTVRRDADPAVRGDRCDHCVDAGAHSPGCPGSMFHRELRVRRPAPPDLVLMKRKAG